MRASKSLLLPKPVSVHSEWCGTRVRTSVMYAETSKMKILGATRSGITMPNTIQAGEHSMAGGTDGASHACYAIFNRWNDERNVNVSRNDNDWNDNWWFAGLRNSLHFERPPRGCSFCLTVWPYHPPSCLPASSRGIESAPYLFVSSEPVSQRIMSRIFNVSSFRSASRIHGSFSLLSRKVAEEAASMHSTKSPSMRVPRV